ncbi:MAG: hypothetical protein LBJ21_01655 [Acidobacteriota bacterium]|nr:hypothetical protein [Acidobacteriota bacterium]
MRELTFEEMDQIGGGGNSVTDGIIRWAVGKVLDLTWNNREAILSHMLAGFAGMAQGIAADAALMEYMFFSGGNNGGPYVFYVS